MHLLTIYTPQSNIIFKPFYGSKSLKPQAALRNKLKIIFHQIQTGIKNQIP